GPLVLFAPTKPLKASDVVNVATGKRKGKLSKRPLGRRTWLFWEDLMPGAMFRHPSLMLLVDADTGRVFRGVHLSLYPIVNGRLPAFLASTRAYHSSRYRVYST